MMQYFGSISRASYIAILLCTILVLAACSSSRAADQVSDRLAIEQVRNYLLATPIDGDQRNPSCLALIEREGPGSVHWSIERPNGDALQVEVLRAGTRFRDFAWMIDANSMSITSLSQSC